MLITTPKSPKTPDEDTEPYYTTRHTLGQLMEPKCIEPYYTKEALPNPQMQISLLAN